MVDKYLKAKLVQSQIVGPFKKQTVPQANFSRFGVIPKKHSNQWRLTVDLSCPPGFSINNGIPTNLCSLSYITVDTAIQVIQLLLKLGRGTLLAKLDVKSAFRLLPVRTSSRSPPLGYVLEQPDLL